jgi:hypothetical protein
VDLIKTAGVLIIQNRFPKDDNEIHNVGNTAGGDVCETRTSYVTGGNKTKFRE